MIATLEEDGNDRNKASILWEDHRPQPLPCQSCFLVAPSVVKSAGAAEDDDDTEIQVDMTQLEPLFDFEQYSTEKLCRDKSVVSTWKDRGDQLLKVGDASAALPYYEYALSMTCKAVSSGSSILVKKKGFVQVAEVDCVDGDILDVTWKETGEEASLRLSENLLTIQETDKDHMQERILLNLTRCLMQIAENAARHRAEYAKAAVLSSSLAHAIAAYHDETSERMVTALLLRAQAQACLEKFAHAQQDLAKVLQKSPNHGQAQQLLRRVQQQQKNVQKREQNLVKEVCKWVETTTTSAAEPTNQGTSSAIHRSKYDKQQPAVAPVSPASSAKSTTKNFWSYLTCSVLE